MGSSKSYAILSNIQVIVTDSVSKSIAKKMDYQLKWILANKNEYEDKFVEAAKEELTKRERSLTNQVKGILNYLFNW